MERFKEVYQKLNTAQRKAVDTIYGPVLVIAGPGTGKTQLLSARVAHILEVTDTLPQNILCLTFTENGALNMRERLTRFIGPHAYDVQISTYHAFGGNLIRRFPEYFTDLRLERPVDELGKRQILSHIIDEVDYRSPIKQVRHHLGDLVGTISEVKRGLLTPDDLRAIAKDNLAAIEKTAAEIGDTLAPHAARMPSKLTVALPLWRNILDILQHSTFNIQHSKTPSLLTLAADTLQTALEEAESVGKTTPLTGWKNKWLAKNKQNQFVLAGTLEGRRINALAGVLESYQTALAEQGLYDFDDMIVRAVEVLETNDDLRYTLQEQYQFVLLDEFQDTNAAQLKLVSLLTDNPANEGRPNVLAVGDDDQAIYAFQGAEYSNMLDFARMFKETTVISLEENYRSAEPILQAASAVAGQIEARLLHSIPEVSKVLIKRAIVPSPTLERTHYASDVAERIGVAAEIHNLVASGVKPSDIAVLAPKHRYLEPLVPYLQQQGLPVAYEKRENVLESPRIRELIAMMKLIRALAAGAHKLADSLWPEVLSYPFWQFSTTDIWRASWQASDERRQWAKVLLDSNEFRHAALLMLTLASRLHTDNAETILDALIGTTEIQTGDRDLPSVRSPFRDYYFHELGETVLFETVSELQVLRAKLREHQLSQSSVLHIEDLLAFIESYEMADEQMLNTSPYRQAEDAVELMTVFKAKGLEWQHVFLLSCHNDVWGSKSSGAGNKLTLPANLAHIRHAGATEDERLRLFFVALTRAKSGLHLSSYAADFSGKTTERLKYLDEVEEDGELAARTLPEGYQKVTYETLEAPSLDALSLDWTSRHLTYQDAPLRQLLSERLQRYQLSPTHLTHFIDLKYGGPESFLLSTLLHFSSAPTVESSFGNAIHETLEWAQNEVNLEHKHPSVKAAIAYADAYLNHEPLGDEQIAQQQRHAADTLETYLAHRTFKKGNVAEMSFQTQGVLIGDVHMGGKIDLLEINEATKEIVVVDYKTGDPESSWKPENIKLHKYALQLYCYKLLVEGSAKYRGYTVKSGRLEFVEADSDGELHALSLDFETGRLEEVRALLSAMWRSVQTLDMPDISNYKDTLTAAKQFEQDLIQLASKKP